MPNSRSSNQPFAEKLATESGDLTEAHEYALKTNEYIKYLNQLTDQRANYLVVASSILIGASVNLGIKPEGDPLHSATFRMIVVTLLPIILAVLLAVTAILPKTFDATSQFHTTAIANMALNEYVEKGKCITIAKSLDFILRENHTVSKIVEYKSKLVKMAAGALYSGIIIGIVSWIGTIVCKLIT